MDAKEYLQKHWIPKQVWTHVNQERHQKRFRRCVRDFTGVTFADVGCALGHSTDVQSKLRPGVWSGIDFFDETINAAKVLFPSISFYSTDNASELKALGIAFDSVVASEIIEHVDDDIAFIKGVWAITKKVLVITTPNQEVKDPGHLRLYNHAMLLDLVSKLDNVILYDIESDPEGFFYLTIVRSNAK
jgi:2-polyprenyl-3-methyl-5-hydroxy-6-metoxy-1,4-benzoquinol methylase